MPYTIFAKNLQFLRKNESLTQAAMQDKHGFKQRNWSNWENDGGEPDYSNLIAISNLFAVPVDWLLKVDLAENVHLLHKSEVTKDELFCTSKSTSNSTPNQVNDPPSDYRNSDKRATDLLILEQLQALTSEVKKIGEKLK
jgi:transcriptional regulator with XRE-family HTH domain